MFFSTSSRLFWNKWKQLCAKHKQRLAHFEWCNSCQKSIYMRRLVIYKILKILYFYKNIVIYKLISWAFAATASIESQYLIQYNKTISLSEQNLIDCSGFGDCSAGFPSVAFNYVIKNGIATSQSYPYTASQGNACQFNSNTIGAFVSGFETIFNNELKMQIAIDTIGPIIVYLNSDPLLTYQSGTIINNSSCSFFTNHVALAVGYGTDAVTKTDYYIVKNSWGSGWGENGYFRIARGVNMCGIGIKGIL